MSTVFTHVSRSVAISRYTRPVYTSCPEAILSCQPQTISIGVAALAPGTVPASSCSMRRLYLTTSAARIAARRRWARSSVIGMRLHFRERRAGDPMNAPRGSLSRFMIALGHMRTNPGCLEKASESIIRVVTMQQPPADLLISIIPSIRTLVEAAAGLGP